MDRHWLLSLPKYQQPCLHPIANYGVTRWHWAMSGVTSPLSPVSPQTLSAPLSPGVTCVTLSVRSPLPPSLLVVAFRLPLEMGEDVGDALLLFRAEAVEGGFNLALL